MRRRSPPSTRASSPPLRPTSSGRWRRRRSSISSAGARTDAEQAAAIVVKVDTGEVLAWVGSSGYYAPAAGAIDFAQTDRSPGSTLKPFIYALALDRGVIAPETKLLDSAFSAGTIANADRSFLGALTPRRALANSRNVPAANLTRAIGLDETFLYLRLLGLNDAERPAALLRPLALDRRPADDAGKAEPRPISPLANDGVMRDLVWLRDGHRGRAAPRHVGRRRATGDAVPGRSEARLPSFPRMGSTEYPFPVALKTGTSQGYRDAWTMAFSRKYLVGVWVGRADAGPMRDLTGASSAAELARAILLGLHGDVPDVAALAFPAPPGYRLGAACAGGADTDCTDELPEWIRASAQPLAGRAEAPSAWPPLADDRATVAIVSPAAGMRVIRNPELPADLASLPLKATVSGGPQIVWYVDGRPLLVARADEVVRWPLQAGTHTFEARLPYRDVVSKPVTVQVE